MFSDQMEVYDLTVSQLKRAAAIKERIESLNNELGRILGVAPQSPKATRKRRVTRVSGKRRIARKSSTLPARAAAKKKKVFSAATRAKLSAKLKAYWAAKRAGKR